MKILALPLPYSTPPDIWLPHRDAFGWPHGAEYDSFKKARTIRLSTRSTFRGHKFPRRFEALSMNEMRPLFAFGFNPYVVDTRDQYPVYDASAFNNAVLRGKRMPVSSVMTIDIVLTVVLPPDNRIHYHGISIKDANDVLSPATQRRHEREQAAFHARGWTWELLRGNQFSKLAFSNHFMMYRCINKVDVFALYEPSRHFAYALYKSSLRGTMDDVLERLARRQRISLDAGYRLFGVAASFGFVTVNHSMPLRTDAPLHLIGINCDE